MATLRSPHRPSPAPTCARKGERALDWRGRASTLMGLALRLGQSVGEETALLELLVEELPAAELVDGPEILDLREAFSALLGLGGVGRAQESDVRVELLCLVGVKEFDKGFGHGTNAVLVHVFVHDRDGVLDQHR